MESYKTENLTFTYPGKKSPALSDISISVAKGEFITVCGKSGCGKSTLLRQLKPVIAPRGEKSGTIYFNGEDINKLDFRTQAREIGFVRQNPDNQIVTDKVWHELAFGMESLGISTPEIRAKVAEMASFFGIGDWFHKSVSELSGGQKQLLNLAGVMVMQPSALILDEPTSQLDPIAAREFINALRRINLELGTTVILSEHRLEEVFPISDRVIVMDSGRIIADGSPGTVCKILKDAGHEMCAALPSPARIYGAVENGDGYPLTVREGRAWLEEYAAGNQLCPERIPKTENHKTAPDTRSTRSETAVELRDVWFRYDKNLPDVIKGLSLKINRGEFFAVVGGNGSGKTTALSLISGINAPYRGKVLINGKSKTHDLYNGVLGVLPQDPQTLFVKKTVRLDLEEMIPEKDKDERISDIAALCRIGNVLDAHPYDLSGGEQQRAALAKVLLNAPEILLLDEPTKGMDADFKRRFADILADLKAGGATVIMVSHDIEFCAEHADRCAMLFDGGITGVSAPREFFSGKSFYTTSANRMARTVLPDAVLSGDVIRACGKEAEEERHDTRAAAMSKKREQITENLPAGKKLTKKRIASGGFFAVLFILTCIFGMKRFTDWRDIAVQFATIIELALCLLCLIPQRRRDFETQLPITGRLSKRTLVAACMILIAVPLTIFIGMYYLGDRKYYFISLLIIIETILPFFMVFEGRKPQARELMIISVICAIGVAGRAAFFMVPQFKPLTAVVIIAGAAFGGETGFLVGAITGFASNFFFGQGPWTPWQMAALGIVGFAAGVLFNNGFLRGNRVSLTVFGAFATFFIYGIIMNSSSVVLWQERPTAEMFLSTYIMGIPFDLIHAASTACFLWFISDAMIEKLERIKTKYGLLEK